MSLKILNIISTVASIFILAISSAFAGDLDFFPGDYSNSKIIGQSLPAGWRPFSADSPWNTKISANAGTHPYSSTIINYAESQAVSGNLRFSNSYVPPLWVVNYDNMPKHIARALYPFDRWDTDLDKTTEAPVPIDGTMWGESESDGHIIVIDPFMKLSWEMSYFRGIRNDGTIDCSTFNIWDLESTGVGDGNEGVRHKSRGGRGSGFPVIAGLIRPEEIAAGEIRHAMAFTFNRNSGHWFIPPAARSDGGNSGNQYPFEGMLFQLNPSLTDSDFNSWGLSRDGKVVARALQQYGMYNSDNGGAMAVQLQNLAYEPSDHRAEWDKLFPGFYTNIRRIPVDEFRVVDTGSPIPGGARTTVVAPLILPLGGTFSGSQTVNMSSATSGVTIRYTTNGSNPTPSSTRYSGPFSITSTATIRARAFKSGMKDSDTTRAPFVAGSQDSVSPSAPRNVVIW